MHRRQIIRLYPTDGQADYFKRCIGASRHAWNWALALRQRYYRWHKKTVSFNRLMRQWNRHKRGKKSWVAEIGKVVTASAIMHLDQSFTAFFRKLSGRPKFKTKKRPKKRFTICDEGQYIKFEAKRVRLPIVGFIRFRGELRWQNEQARSATIFQKGDRFFLSLLFELPDIPPPNSCGPVCGVDLGCTTFATVASEDKIVEELTPPKPYAKAKRILRRLARSMSRKKKGSQNRKKAIVKFARRHERVANVRDNFLHQSTSRLVKRYGVIVLEDLSVKGMMAGILAGTIADSGFGKFRQQVEYKAEAFGVKVVLANRFYPSSKTCSRCGLVKTKLELSERTWTCEGCGVTHNRDHNAAFNLEKLGRGTPEVTPAEIGVSPPSHKTKRAAGRGSRIAKCDAKRQRERP